jgi:aminoglycoside 2'-N-acetyltransferase I
MKNRSDDAARVRRSSTAALSGRELRAIRRLMDEAFAADEHGGFSDDDWQHALGGEHFLVMDGESVVGHASVVSRELHVAGRPISTGYVEAVATAAARQRQGIGSAVMRQVNDYIGARYDLGALGTGSHAFYERLGWQRWRGPTSVRADDGERRTPEEDGYIMVLLTPATPPLQLDLPISCEWRPGDVW